MPSVCRLVCMLVAASGCAISTSAIYSAATAKPNSRTGELGTDHVYHAHAGLCKSKNPAHGSFAGGHSALTQTVLRTPRLLRSCSCGQMISSCSCAHGLQITRSMTRAFARRSAIGTRAVPLTSGETGATYRRNGGSKPWEAW